MLSTSLKRHHLSSALNLDPFQGLKPDTRRSKHYHCSNHTHAQHIQHTIAHSHSIVARCPLVSASSPRTVHWSRSVLATYTQSRRIRGHKPNIPLNLLCKARATTSLLASLSTWWPAAFGRIFTRAVTSIYIHNVRQSRLSRERPCQRFQHKEHN